MKKILLLPFLSIPSGHHQAADAFISRLKRIDPSVHCEKVDIFSYSYGRTESIVSRFYLTWIHRFPSSYSALYKKMVLSGCKEKDRDRYVYEYFFERQMERLLREKQPDCAVCTHALPSRLLSRLKEQGKTAVPVFNVYTDYFIHEGWGIRAIDGHFVSTARMKDYLIKNGVPEEKIFFTGIPTHPALTKPPAVFEPPRRKIHVLISGGSTGAGNLQELLSYLGFVKGIHYYVLCGKNSRLYSKLKYSGHAGVTPLPYIRSRKMMDLIYNSADLVVTKPGGVTVAECVHKRLPIFVYDKLPGQEEMNFTELKQEGLIYPSAGWRRQNGLSEEIIRFMYSGEQAGKYFSDLIRYEREKMAECPAKIVLGKISDGRTLSGG